MWEGAAWQTVWDWAGKLGLGGLAGALAGWFLQRWIGNRDKAEDRGRQLVNDARPELVPMGNVGGQYVLALNVENRGTGTARTTHLAFTELDSHTRIETRDEVPVGGTRLTAALNIAGSSFFTRQQDRPSEITLEYTDRYGNEHRLLIPARQQRRGDGGFNMNIDWIGYRNEEAKLTKEKLREIGR